MGNCVGGFKKYTKKRTSPFCKKRKVCLCVLGVDGVGKSTIVKALANDDISKVLPTNGFAFCKISYKSVKIKLYDLGGDGRIRAIWSNYYSEVHGVIFVVDGTSLTRLKDNKELLTEMLGNADLSLKPLLLLINKKDRSGCLDEIQLSDKLGLHELAERHAAQIRVECCSAIHGIGKNIDKSISDGIDWLLDRILENYSSLSKRVSEARERLKIRQHEDRKKRLQRITAETFENSREEEKLNFAQKLACGYKHCDSTTMNGSGLYNGKKLTERTRQFCKFSKPRVVPLHSALSNRHRRSASDPAMQRTDGSLSSVLRATVVPSFLPLSQKPNSLQTSDGDVDIKTSRTTCKCRLTKNQVIPLSIFPTDNTPSTSKEA